MSSVRIPFESYAAQHNITNASLSTYVGQSANANKMNNFNTNDSSHSSFKFQPRSHFVINSVEEDEIPEEKMHSPRTPYGSVPDPINNNTSTSNNNNNSRLSNNNNSSRWLYPPQTNQTVNPLDQMQRTVSASSLDSIRSYSAHSTTMEHENVLNMPMNYTPTLSATSSINRSGTYSTSTSPDASPIGSPKAYKLRKSNSFREEQRKRHHHRHNIQIHTDETKEEREDEEEDRKSAEEYEEKYQSFSSSRPSSTKYVDTDDRNVSIEALAKKLLQVKNKKRNGFHLYRHGLSTYSNGTNSGVNSNGTATPNSIGALSRSSSCNEYIGGSECSFGDEPNVVVDGEHVADDGEFIDSGASTPFEPDVTALSTTKLAAEFSEDEMETPVPTSTTEHHNEDESPFDFDTRLPIPILAEISEDVEHETIHTPNTNITIVSGESKESEEDHIILHELEERPPHFDIIDDDSSDDDEEPIPQEIHSPNPIGMKLVNDGDDEDDDELCMDLEDEIIIKGSRFQSSRVLFLDVDGVLLSVSEQAKLGKGENIKFNDDVTSLMIKVCRETDCDIVISSTWQFYQDTHLKYLTAYLIACGWAPNKIHTLLDLLPSHANDGINYGREWYEQSPYCRCRARGIQKIVALYGQYITRWCCLDDLPLHSQKPVCIPKKEDVTSLVDEISNAYFKPFEWRKHQKSELMPDIKYCVKYAITSLPNCIFSTQSYRFGYEYNQTMIYYQADAIAKLCKLTYEIKDNVTYQLILQGMIAVINGYIGANLTYQGDPYIAPFLVQTDQSVGITPQNIENVITLLTYQDRNHLQQQQLQNNSQQQLNDNNNLMNTAEVTTV